MVRTVGLFVHDGMGLTPTAQISVQSDCTAGSVFELPSQSKPKAKKIKLQCQTTLPTGVPDADRREPQGVALRARRRNETTIGVPPTSGMDCVRVRESIAFFPHGARNDALLAKAAFVR